MVQSNISQHNNTLYTFVLLICKCTGEFPVYWCSCFGLDKEYLFSVYKSHIQFETKQQIYKKKINAWHASQMAKESRCRRSNTVFLLDLILCLKMNFLISIQFQDNFRNMPPCHRNGFLIELNKHCRDLIFVRILFFLIIASWFMLNGMSMWVITGSLHNNVNKAYAWQWRNCIMFTLK